MTAAKAEDNRGRASEPRSRPVPRPARPEDAADMARLADLAGGGLPRHLWARQAAPGEDAIAVGARRAARDEGPFSWRNAVIAEVGGATAGMLVTYRVADAPEPLDDAAADVPAAAVAGEPGARSLYVNMLATYPAFRRRGVARALLAEAERAGRHGAGCASSSPTTRPRPARLCRAFGFVEIAEEALVPEDWATASRAWVLMTKAR